MDPAPSHAVDAPIVAWDVDTSCMSQCRLGCLSTTDQQLCGECNDPLAPCTAVVQVCGLHMTGSETVIFHFSKARPLCRCLMSSSRQRQPNRSPDVARSCRWAPAVPLVASSTKAAVLMPNDLFIADGLHWILGGGHCDPGSGRPFSQHPASHQPDKAAAAVCCAAARQAGHGAGEQLRRGRRPSGRQDTRHVGGARSGGARAKRAASGPCQPGSSAVPWPLAAAAACGGHAGGGHQPGPPCRPMAHAGRRLAGPRAVSATDAQHSGEPAGALDASGARHKQHPLADAQPARHGKRSTGRQNIQGYLTTTAAAAASTASAAAAAAGAHQSCVSKAAATTCHPQSRSAGNAPVRWGARCARPGRCTLQRCQSCWIVDLATVHGVMLVGLLYPVPHCVNESPCEWQAQDASDTGGQAAAGSTPC